MTEPLHDKEKELPVIADNKKPSTFIKIIDKVFMSMLCGSHGFIRALHAITLMAAHKIKIEALYNNPITDEEKLAAEEERKNFDKARQEFARNIIPFLECLIIIPASIILCMTLGLPIPLMIFLCLATMTSVCLIIRNTGEKSTFNIVLDYILKFIHNNIMSLNVSRGKDKDGKNLDDSPITIKDFFSCPEEVSTAIGLFNLKENNQVPSTKQLILEFCLSPLRLIQAGLEIISAMFSLVKSIPVIISKITGNEPSFAYAQQPYLVQNNLLKAVSKLSHIILTIIPIIPILGIIGNIIENPISSGFFKMISKSEFYFIGKSENLLEEIATMKQKYNEKGKSTKCCGSEEKPITCCGGEKKEHTIPEEERSGCANIPKKPTSEESSKKLSNPLASSTEEPYKERPQDQSSTEEEHCCCNQVKQQTDNSRRLSLIDSTLYKDISPKGILASSDNPKLGLS